MESLGISARNLKQYPKILNPMEKDLIIVDDDWILLVILEKMFEKVNPDLRISTFLKGEEALAFLLNNDFVRLPFLMVDLYLKDTSGWEVLEKLDDDGRFESKVVLITSSVESQNSKKSSRYKCVSSFFEKPITFDKIKIINRLIVEQRLN